jgi:hypothetical protein
MTPQEERIVTQWKESIPEKILLGATWKEDEAGRKIRAFCKTLRRLVPQLRVEEEEDLDESMPEIRVRENVRYSAVPEAKELEPFLRALHSAVPLAGALKPSLRELLQDLDVPASIRVYISPQCPFCPQTVMQCLALADASKSCRVHVVDGALFPEQAEKDGIRSVPTVILDQAFRWTGSVKSEELVKMIVHRDPLQLSSDSLEQMLHSGRAEEVADMMDKRGEVFPGLLDLLVHRKWPVRLGAMVTFQHLVESRPDLASQITLSLWDRFPRVDDPIKGDILFLFGESRDPSLLPMLTSVIEGRHPPEVQDAAKDAVKSISERLP